MRRQMYKLGVYYNICGDSSPVDSTTSFPTDINECEEGVSGCSQLCNNTVGSYLCSCTNGYSLLEDGRNCVGTYCCTKFL